MLTRIGAGDHHHGAQNVAKPALQTIAGLLGLLLGVDCRQLHAIARQLRQACTRLVCQRPLRIFFQELLQSLG